MRDRSFQKFGERMLPGGDLYEREQRFFRMVERRKAGDSEEWADSLGCVVIKVDGTKAIWENVEIIAGFLSGEGRAETGRRFFTGKANLEGRKDHDIYCGL